MLEHFFQTIADGITYDLVKGAVVSLAGTALATLIISKISDKLKGKRDFIIVSAGIWALLFLAFLMAASPRQRPNLVGSINNSILADVNGTPSTVGMITMAVANNGNIQSIMNITSVEVKIGLDTYRAMFPMMPPQVTFNLPNLGQDSPQSITFNRQDDIREKWQQPIQPGGLLTGTIYILFQNVQAQSIKSGAELVVNYVDVFGHEYSISQRISPQLSVIGKIPGLHSELACRPVPQNLNSISPPGPQESLVPPDLRQPVLSQPAPASKEAH